MIPEDFFPIFYNGKPQREGINAFSVSLSLIILYGGYDIEGAFSARLLPKPPIVPLPVITLGTHDGLEEQHWPTRKEPVPRCQSCMEIAHLKWCVVQERNSRLFI